MNNLLNLTMEMSENKNLEDIKVFVSSIKDKPENIEYINLLLTGFCQFDNLEGVKFLLFDSGINKEYLLNYSNNQPLRVAAKYDNKDIVEFLLTDTNLKNLIDIHARDEDALYYASANSNLDLVKFLCLSPQLIQHSDISNGRALEIACYNKDEDIIKFFIHDLKIEIPFLLGRRIDSDSEFNMDGRLYEIIDGRDNAIKLHQNLTQDLQNKSDTKKMKI